jgi:hypothetical protein
MIATDLTDAEQAALLAKYQAEADEIAKVVPKSNLPASSFGKWRIQKYLVDEEDGRRLFRKSLQRQNSYRDPWTPPGIYTKLVAEHNAMFDNFVGDIMYDTLEELAWLYPFVLAAKGEVLVTGLGLGIATGALLARPDVANVTVIELEPEVITLVGKFFVDNKRLRIINDNAWTWQPDQSFDCAWHDCWWVPPRADRVGSFTDRLKPYVGEQHIYGLNPQTMLPYDSVK